MPEFDAPVSAAPEMKRPRRGAAGPNSEQVWGDRGLLSGDATIAQFEPHRQCENAHIEPVFWVIAVAISFEPPERGRAFLSHGWVDARVIRRPLESL